MWTVLTIIAVVGLLLFWGDKQNPVRGSLTLGLLGGLIAAGVYFFLGYDFLWSTVGKWIVVIVVITVAQEAFRWVSKRARR
jgi:hypothetical protein